MVFALGPVDERHGIACFTREPVPGPFLDGVGMGMVIASLTHDALGTLPRPRTWPARAPGRWRPSSRSAVRRASP